MHVDANRARRHFHALVVIGAAFLCFGLQTTATAQEPQPEARLQGVERLRDEDDVRVPPDADEIMRPEALSTGDYRVDALLSGYRLYQTTVTYSFYEDSVFGGTYYGSEVVSEVSEQVKTNVRAIMAGYGAVLNMNFVEVTETSSNVGVIRIMRSSGPSYAYAYYPSNSTMFSVAGDVHLNPNYDRLGDTNGFQHPAGQHGYVSLVHELGHALGLKHPHEAPALPSGEDNDTNTVMSYRFLGAAPGTPMSYDLLALAYLYGTRANRTGNDVYVGTRADVDQYSVGGQVVISPSTATKLTIWDTGGYNTLDLSGVAGSSSGYRVDLRPLGWITSGYSYQTTYYNAGISLGPGVSIRKVVSSISNDTIYANAEANVFAGYSATRATGADTIYGADGADVIDLSGYLPGQVMPTANGADLVLDLGANGRVTVVGYYSVASPPSIVYAAATPAVSVGDVSITEGNTGSKTVAFPVTLSLPPSASVTVNWATAAGTASAGSDFVGASGALTFTAGQTQKTVSVTVLGDTVFEGDEIFSILLSNPGAGLTVVDGQGNATILDDDVAPNQPPVAAASATPTTGEAPLAVTFSSAGSSDPDGTISTYAWAFGNGATSSAADPVYTYPSAGTFTATLTVTDNKGATAFKSVTITVVAPNQPPVAAASATPTTGEAPLAVTFSSAGSSDPDGTISTYAWAFGNGATSSVANPAYTYPSAGTFTATLTVTDNKGATASKSVTITVQPAAAVKMHVSSIVMGETINKNGYSYALATIHVADAMGRPVLGASVTLTFSGLVRSTLSGTTDVNGRVILKSRVARKPGTITATVNGISKTGYVYDASSNVVTSGSVTVGG